jgi:hypothetical protein
MSLGAVVGLDDANAPGNIPALADLLFSKYVFAFEVTSALLITAALGAMVLAHRERLGLKVTQRSASLRRFAERAGRIRAHFTRWAVALDPELGVVLSAGSGIADALEAIAVAARAWVLRFGPGDPWRIACSLSGGALLSNTSSPFPAVR